MDREGSLTNREKRTIELNLDLLPEGQKYEATLYEDAEDSHFVNNRESYSVRKELVDHTIRLII